MAAVGAQYLTPATSFPSLSTNSPPPPRMQPVLLHSAISTTTPFPSKPTRRKNYLRQKLLKTVTKPVIPYTNPVIPIESPHESETQESQVSTAETAGILSGNFGNFSARSVFQLGLYLVGAFVFQTICAVWIWGSVNSDQKDGNLDSGSKTRVLELSGKGDNEAKPGFFMNGSGGSVSGRGKSKQWPELDERIVEIQAMARETRERERLDSKENGSDDYDDVQTEIEEEVDLRVANLLKRLQNSNKKSPVFPVRYLGKGAGSQVGANKPLMFRKRYKFRSPSGNPSDKLRGFPGSEDHNLTRNGNGSAIVEDALLGKGSVDKEQLLYHPNGNSRGNVSLPLDEDSGRKLSKDKSKSFETQRKKLGNGRAKAKVGKEYGIAKPEQGSGATREKGFGRPSVKAGRSRKATAGSKRASGKVEIKQSDDNADLWWLSLPYVLAIFMRRGNDDEGQSGLFTLKTTPYVEGEDSYEDPSHFVAFEDRGDATNFCYLLESFFEDLGDFSAEIVPLPIKELNEAVSSDVMKVIVVKKGQLKLYAGQPLAEVENELRSLVK